MEKIKLTADSICDLTPELLSQYDIALCPLIINLGDESIHDAPGVPERIYEFAERTKTTPKTSALSVPEYEEFFAQHLPKDGALIHFNISGEISSTYNNAVAAAKNLKNVYVIDSRSLTTGTAISILRAAKYREQGLTAADIVDKVNAARDQVQCSFIVKDLTYLHRGGRCSGTARLFATALGIKPQIVLTNGKMIPGKKFMGNFDSCVKKYVDYTLTTNPNPDLDICFITHTAMDNPETVANVRSQILAKYPFKQVVETIASGTVTSHCGKNTLGIIYGLQ